MLLSLFCSPESLRDNVDIVLSVKVIPTVNVAEKANSIAKLGNKLVAGMFSLHKEI